MRITTAFPTICLISLLSSLSPSMGEDFIVSEGRPPVFQPQGFSSGDRLIFRNEIISFGSPAVILMPPPGDVTYLFEETSVIASQYSRSAIDVSSFYYNDFAKEMEILHVVDPILMEVEDSTNFIMDGDVTAMGGRAITFEDSFKGSFSNSGNLSSANDSTIFFEYDFEGDFVNTGTIDSSRSFDGPFGPPRPPILDSDEGESFERISIEEDIDQDEAQATVAIYRDFSGSFLNSGTIRGIGGVAIGGNMTGTFTNAGTIQSDNLFGVLVAGDFDGDFINTGTISPLEFSEEDLLMEDDQAEERELSMRIPYQYGMEPTFLEFGTLFEDRFDGNFLNRGTIKADSIASVFEGDFSGSFKNFGTIEGGDTGVSFDSSFDGSFENSGDITTAQIEDMEQPEFPEDDEFIYPVLIDKEYFDGPRSGVRIGANFTGNFTNSGTIRGEDAGIYFNGAFSGRLENSGTIDGTDGVGIAFTENMTGELINSRLILGTYHAVVSQGNFGGRFSNSGRIASLDDNALKFENFTGELTNTGVIDSVNGAAFSAENTTGTILNAGGRISGKTKAIELGSGNGKVILSGSSVINGVIDGGSGDNDVIRFENIRGLSAEKRNELAALAAADSTGDSSITLFGETISWTAFEDVQINLESIESYENLFSTTGFGQYGAALDNVAGLNDEIRVFLNALGDLNEDELKQAAANSSGQTVAASAGNYVRSQGSEVFSLFSADFSSLRTGGGGASNSNVASNGRNGLFTREIQVGVTVNEPIDESHAFVSGYMGRGTQDPNENRAESTINSTSVMFGRSEAVSSQWRVGMWGGYTDNDVDVDTFGSQLESEAGLIGASVQYQGDYGFSNLVVGYGFHNQKSNRRDFLGNQMIGDTDGHQGLVHGQFGRDFYFGEESNLQVSPYLGFALSRLKMGAYSEQGPTAAALRFDSQTTDSVQSAVGVNVSQYHETRTGWIRPKVDAVWWHEFAEADSLGVSLAAPGLLNPFQVESAVSNRDRAVVQIGMEMGFDKWENVTFDASYFGTYGEDGYTAHGGALSAEFKF